MALAHGRGHGRRDLAQQCVRNNDADGPHDDIRAAAVHRHCIFTGGGTRGTGLAHGVCRQTVGAHRSEPDLRALRAQGRHQLFAKAPALPVDDEHIHRLHQKSISSRRSSAMI